MGKMGNTFNKLLLFFSKFLFACDSNLFKPSHKDLADIDIEALGRPFPGDWE
jgi:hypothetical protein